MQRLFVFYRLRPEVTVDEFMTWSREVDQPQTGAYPECKEFNVYPVVGQGDGELLQFDIAEELLVDDFEVWQAVLASPVHKPIADAFDELVEPGSVQSAICQVTVEA